MEEYKMNCATCFYSQQNGGSNSAPAFGRDEKGREVEAENIFITYVICSEGPKPLLISTNCTDAGETPDVVREPELHRCGRGRWWEDGSYIRWVDAEDISGE
jgi:hypothetical protein